MESGNQRRCGTTNATIEVLTNAYLASNGPTFAVSEWIPLRGNAVSMSLLVLNFSGSNSPAVTAQLEGTNDGSAPFSLGSTATGSAFGPVSPVAVTQITCGYVRVLAEVSAGDAVKALLNVTLTFTQQ